MHQSSPPSSRCWWSWRSSWRRPGFGLWPGVRRHGCRRLCEASACACLRLGLFAPAPRWSWCVQLALNRCFCVVQTAEVYVFSQANGTLTILPCWCRCWATTWPGSGCGWPWLPTPSALGEDGCYGVFAPVARSSPGAGNQPAAVAAATKLFPIMPSPHNRPDSQSVRLVCIRFLRASVCLGVGSCARGSSAQKSAARIAVAFTNAA